MKKLELLGLSVGCGQLFLSARTKIFPTKPEIYQKMMMQFAMYCCIIKL